MTAHALMPSHAGIGAPDAATTSHPRRTVVARRFAFWSILGLAFIVRAGVALLLPGAHHPDETYQAFEQAHRYAFGYGIKPWEFDEGLRSTLLPALLSVVFRFADAIVGTPEAMLGLSRLLLAALSLLPVAAIFAAGQRRSPHHALLGAFVAATWSQLVYFSHRPLTEALAADFLLTALALMSFHRGRISPRTLIAIGVCLGLALMLRVHFAPAVAIVGWVACSASWRSRPQLRSMMLVGSAAAIPVAAFGIADWVAWGVPFHAPYTAFRLNLVEGIAARFGTASPYTYLAVIIARLGWVAVPVALLVRAGARDYALWLVVAAAILVPHSLIAHKEYRFVFVCAPILVIVASFVSIDLWKRWIAERSADRRWHGVTLAGIATAWTIASLSVAAQPGEWSDWHRQRAAHAAIQILSHDPALCGLALEGVSWTQLGGYAALHRSIPIYQTRGGERPPHSEAFNTVLSHSTMPALQGYATLRCFDDAIEGRLCLQQRPGLCTPDASIVPLTQMPSLGDPRLYVE